MRRVMNRLKKEYLFFRQQEPNMKTLLVTNMLYVLVLPIIEIFIGAYIMRNMSDPMMAAFYQLIMYVDIITTSFVNGYLLKKYSVKALYPIGILVSGISMFDMVTIKPFDLVELDLTGSLMGAASGLFQINRYLLALYSTSDNSRSYFFGSEFFFFSITSIGVPLVIDAFINQTDGKEVFGSPFNISTSYYVVTMAAVVTTIIAYMTLWRGKFKNLKEANFPYFRFNMLWKKTLWLAGLKGMVQGFLVTASAILVLKLVGDEGVLGLIQGISEALATVLVCVLGRAARLRDHLKIFVGGLIVFFVGTLFNGTLFSAIGIILFALCKVIFQPLLGLAYSLIMMRTIDAVAKIESRDEYAYILSHESDLFPGRAPGLLPFIFLAYYVLKDFALEYVLVIVAGLQLATYPLTKNTTSQTDTIEHENDK